MGKRLSAYSTSWLNVITKIKITMKLKGCIKLFRREVELEKSLTDPELRLYLLCRRLADWDPRHKEGFGTVKASIRKLQKEYLPRWSVGKICTTINGLIAKGWLERLGSGVVGVKNFWIYQLLVSQADQILQQIEQGVPLSEQTVRQPVQGQKFDFEQARRDLAKKLKIP